MQQGLWHMKIAHIGVLGKPSSASQMGSGGVQTAAVDGECMEANTKAK